MKKYGGIAYTEKNAMACIEKAKKSLSIFEPSKIKESLIDIADYVMARRI
jgi:geranylgeranyl pyrophosphate synthase